MAGSIPTVLLLINLNIKNKMPREPQSFKREYKGEVVININDIFRNPEIQKEVERNVKKFKRK